MSDQFVEHMSQKYWLYMFLLADKDSFKFLSQMGFHISEHFIVYWLVVFSQKVCEGGVGSISLADQRHKLIEHGLQKWDLIEGESVWQA